MLITKTLVETNLTESVVKYLEQNYITNLNIFGVIENSNKSKIYVDDIENPNGVIVIDGDFNYYIYTESDDFIYNIVDNLLKEKGEYNFGGVEKSIADKIMKVCEVDWMEPCLLYYYPKDNVDKSKVKSKVRSLSLEDAYTVNEHYTYKGEDSIYNIIDNIKNRDSVGVYIDEELVSWVMIHDDNSMGVMYTKEEYRKEGYAVDVTLSLVDKLLKKGKTPFLQIVEGNTASQSLANKCGFVQYGKCTWFGITIK